MAVLGVAIKVDGVARSRENYSKARAQIAELQEALKRYPIDHRDYRQRIRVYRLWESTIRIGRRDPKRGNSIQVWSFRDDPLHTHIRPILGEGAISIKATVRHTRLNRLVRPAFGGAAKTRF